MHIRGDPASMQSEENTAYSNLVAQVRQRTRRLPAGSAPPEPSWRPIRCRAFRVYGIFSCGSQRTSAARRQASAEIRALLRLLWSVFQVAEELDGAATQAVQEGVSPWHIIVDPGVRRVSCARDARWRHQGAAPCSQRRHRNCLRQPHAQLNAHPAGIGFAKTSRQNFQLIRSLDALRASIEGGLLPPAIVRVCVLPPKRNQDACHGGGFGKSLGPRMEAAAGSGRQTAAAQPGC